MKKLLAMLLALCMVLTGVTALAAEDGVYQGTGAGRNGDIVMQVTIADGKITAVEPVSHNETPGICDAAFQRIPAAIVENQSIAVDAVAGATISSEGILAAVSAALTAAGLDPADFSAAVEAQAGDKQTVEADVVIIGAGGAGLAAAITAAEAGATVAVIEKTAAVGGNTIVSGGYLNAVDAGRAAGMEPADVSMYYALTEVEPRSERHAYWQNELKTALDEYFAGPQDHLFDCLALHILQTYDGGDYVGKLELIENLCTKAPEAITWLEGMGMEYDDGLYTVTGGLWARGHKALKPNGTGYFEVFTAHIAENELPINIYFETKAEHFIMDGDKVTGVEAVSVVDGTPYEFLAGRKVILASGGFGANVEMREFYNTKWASLDETVNTSEVAASTGDGITMALEIGIALEGMEWIQLHPLLSPKGVKAAAVATDTEHYIQVNREGNRYIAEDSRRDELSAAGLLQTNGEMWEITDINGVYAGIDAYVDAGYCYRGDTLEELAEAIGVPAENFVAAVNQYNQAVETGVDEAFGRTLLKCKIDTAPFYAGLCKPGVHHTMGGVRVDTECNVYREDGSVVEGLLAAGEVTGGLHGSNRVGGNAVADAMVNGRIAGANAVKAEVKTADVLVVGSGIAGMTAANAAKDAGADVLMIDKMPTTGGTTRISGGYVITVGTRYTAEGAINEPEDMLAYWKNIADQCRDTGYPDYDRVASIWATNDESIQNLIELGVPLGDQAFAGGYALMHSEGNGAGMIEALEKTTREKGIEILLDCKAEELITEDDAVVGVRAVLNGAPLEIYAKSIVLCTGGYSQNPELVARYAPELCGTISTAAVSSTGDGILMAEAVGAATFDNYWFSICPLQVSMDYLMAGGSALTCGDKLGVNAEGVRYAAESDVAFSYESTYKTILDGKDPHWFLFDSANADLVPVLEAGIELGEVVKGETLAEAAAAAGLDEAAFLASAQRYAELVAAGEDADFGKSAAMLVPCEQAPYYLVKFYPAAWGSMGGVKTDLETAAVLRADGSVIPGLYAAGETSNRDFYNEVYYGAASLTIYSNMGRRAGIAAAEYAR